MSEKLLIYLLEGCMYTQEMLNLLKNIDCYYHIKFVNQNDKGSVKLSNNMYSFPQVFYVVNNIKHKIGGYDEFKLLSEFKYYKKSYANDI